MPDQPGGEVRERKGCHCESLLHRHIGVLPDASVTETACSDGVRKSACNLCSLMVLRCELGLLFALASHLQRLRASLWTNRKGPTRGNCLRRVHMYR
jgi:hypothetical protein